MKKAFMDTETTGLDSNTAQILTAALVIEDGDNVVFEREWKIKQQDWATIDPYAMQVNKINLVEHNAVAQDEDVVLMEIVSALRQQGMMNAILYGHNVSFDIGFLRAAYQRHRIGFPFTYHFGDSMILALVLRDAGIKSFVSLRLSDLCEHYGIVASQFHSALADTKASAELYRALLAEIRVEKSRKPVPVDGHFNCGVCGCSHVSYADAENCCHGGRAR